MNIRVSGLVDVPRWLLKAGTPRRCPNEKCSPPDMASQNELLSTTSSDNPFLRPHIALVYSSRIKLGIYTSIDTQVRKCLPTREGFWLDKPPLASQAERCMHCT